MITIMSTKKDFGTDMLVNFSGLTPATRRLHKGETLFSTDDEVVNFYAVVSGKIRLARNMPDGQDVTFYVAAPGQMIAEASLFSQSYHCDAVADLATDVAVYRKSELLALLGRDHVAGFGFMAYLAREVQQLRSHVQLIHIKSARQRVLAYIQSNSAGQDLAITIDGTWKSVSSHINLTPEATYRALSELENDDIITRRGMQVTLARDPMWADRMDQN